MTFVLGIACAAACTLLFGSIFVPIKKFQCGDGFAAQLFLCLGGFIVSLIVNLIQGCPPVQPLAMIAGALWCAANCSAIPIMNELGMAMGILIWSTFSCLFGWATGRFGLFGVAQSVPNSVTLNYLGILMLIVGSFFYLFVKSNPNSGTKQKGDPEEAVAAKGSYNPNAGDEVAETTVHHHASMKTKLICVATALVAGAFYGSMYTPISYMKSHRDMYPDAPQDAIYYIFSFFLGVMLMSVTAFTGYIIVMRNRPWINHEACLPSLVAGIIFGSGMVFFYSANEMLSQTIAYPVCALAPGLVCSLWSVLYFKEITEKKSLVILAGAYIFTLCGILLVTVSKEI